MLICALQTYAVVIIVAVIAAQYAFALFCLLKLAYLDITKKEYVLWNLFVLLVFFIGGIAFLVYYYKVKDAKSIKAIDGDAPASESAEVAETAEASETAETEERAPADASEAEAEPAEQSPTDAEKPE